MASIRRTLSPLMATNGRDLPTSLPPQTQSPRSSSSSSCSSSHSISSSPFRRLLISVMRFFLFLDKTYPHFSFSFSSRKCSSHHQHHHHHHHHQYYCLGLGWKKRSFLLRLFVFFLLGFLLGLSPFSCLHDAADLKPHHFFFDSVGTVTSSRPLYAANSNANIIINPHNHNHRNLGAHLPQKMKIKTTKKMDNPDLDLVVNNDATAAVVVTPPTTPPGGGAAAAAEEEKKLLIIVTPTYNRALQAYYLSRLGQTLRLVPPPLLWIVVEMKSASAETADILRRTGVMYRHLVCCDGDDKDSSRTNSNSNNIKDRGVHQRNTALEHIQRHFLDGIVYFADDDNIYSLQLFHHLRSIRRFGTWPVAMLAQSKNKATLEGPVCNGSQVIGWHTNEKSRRVRRFHVDMSGFAFNSTILWDPKRWRRPTSDAIRQLDTVKEGFQETTFIEQVVEDESQMEGIPHACSKIMNWHLHLEARHLIYPKGWLISRNLDVVGSLR